MAGSTAIERTHSAPGPAIITAFISDECACDEAVDGPLARPDAGLAGSSVAGGVEGREQGRERRGGRGVPDDSPAAAVLEEPELLGQTERLCQPVDDDLLDLGDRRAGGPDHPLCADAARDEVAEDRRGRRVGRKVGEESWVLPVRQAGHDELVEVGQQCVERLPDLRGRRRQRAAYGAGRHRDSTGRSSGPAQ
ncbi:hypothetical protein LP418_25135 [Nocardioides sp. B-3]|nr:hypothetical protein [Nocardioides sp. B-3]UUZ59169.1 hypothetical protein LP418_25135 [Nocardioides sp. B-3]